jgi:hypothetical protein
MLYFCSVEIGFNASKTNTTSLHLNSQPFYKKLTFVFLAPSPTCGKRRSTPNGASLSFNNPFISAIISRNIFGVYLAPPSVPKPPAFVTAAASSGPATWSMPASMMGCRMRRRDVRGVVRGGDILGVLIGRANGNEGKIWGCVVYNGYVCAARVGFVRVTAAQKIVLTRLYASVCER